MGLVPSNFGFFDFNHCLLFLLQYRLPAALRDDPLQAQLAGLGGQRTFMPRWY
jgi:hypothetical protein